MSAGIRRAFIVVLAMMLVGCGQLISNAKKEFAQDLSATILDHDDTETIKQAVPAYMVLVSSMIRSDPDNAELLMSGAKLYGSYASVFVDDTKRKQILAARSFDYASRAVCLRNPELCDLRKLSFQQFEILVKQAKKNDAEVLFVLSSSWAGLIQANSSDWNAIAELPRVKVSIERVLQLDEGFSNGDAHLYMGVMESLLPPSAGGKPEAARAHFERSIELSNGSNLTAKLLYAEKYARLLFDRELHDRLLNEILAADIEQSASRLTDIFAKQRARELLADADDYF